MIPVQVVLARVEEETAVDPTRWTRARGDGVNPEHPLVPVRVAKACLWKQHGTAADIDAARAFAAREGWTVYLYSRHERYPLTRAKADVLRAAYEEDRRSTE
jgi:hypothetical protein